MSGAIAMSNHSVIRARIYERAVSFIHRFYPLSIGYFGSRGRGNDKFQFYALSEARSVQTTWELLSCGFLGKREIRPHEHPFERRPEKNEHELSRGAG